MRGFYIFDTFDAAGIGSSFGPYWLSSDGVEDRGTRLLAMPKTEAVLISCHSRATFRWNEVAFIQKSDVGERVGGAES